jgi:hypothetical protein
MNWVTLHRLEVVEEDGRLSFHGYCNSDSRHGVADARRHAAEARHVPLGRVRATPEDAEQATGPWVVGG